MIQLSHKTIKTIKIIFNVIFISIIVFSLIRRMLFSIPDDWLFFFTSDAVENFVFVAIAYVLYYFVLKLKDIWKKISCIFLFIAVLIAIASLKDYRIHLGITLEGTFEYFTSFFGQTVLFYALVYFVNKLEFLYRYKKLETELNQAKEQLLRNQLHPHFLFNAFNSLYSLSLKNHPETSQYILKLSSMMRYITDETHLNKVRLAKELDFIKQYIAIEKIRFGNDIPIQFTSEGNNTDEKLIAPFLLITLVENAFKHGFYTNLKGAFVNINLNIVDNELLFTVENGMFKKQHFQESNRKGKGLENLKERLYLLYPKKSSLEISNTEDIYTAQLKISLT